MEWFSRVVEEGWTTDLWSSHRWICYGNEHGVESCFRVRYQYYSPLLSLLRPC
ncbi:unnamed protein product [Caenorhabditis brenneri]